MRRSLIAIAAAGTLACGSKHKVPANSRFSVMELPIRVGADSALVLTRPEEAADRPHIVNVEVLPGCGMNIYQIRAFLPGRGVVPLLASPPLEVPAKLWNSGGGDDNGGRSFSGGGPLFVPFAQRIRGRLAPDRRHLLATVAGRDVRLPADTAGGGEPYAGHGLILDKRFATVSFADARHAEIRGRRDAGDFEGHWIGDTALTVKTVLTDDAFEFSVTAANHGREPAPVGIGWRPCFKLPSGRREQARLRIPAARRALVNSRANLFPTGAIVPVAGTPYDFHASGGAALRQLSLDDCFVDIDRDAGGQAVAEIIDPAARYGLRLRALSPEVKAFHAHAPRGESLVALAPQFNLENPYGAEWPKDVDTGMVALQPGQAVTYRVRLELFIP